MRDQIRRIALLSLAVLCWSLDSVYGQGGGVAPVPTVVDSIVVIGNVRNTSEAILAVAALAPESQINYRQIQRAIQELFATGQFDDVTVNQRELPGGRLLLEIVVRERPLLLRWAIRGAEKIDPRTLRGRVTLPEGRPVDRAAIAKAIYAMDSLYTQRGYYAAEVRAVETTTPDGDLSVFFDVSEGNRVAIKSLFEVWINSAKLRLSAR